MKTQIIIQLIAIEGFASTVATCDQPTIHYTSMGCTPSEQTNDLGCPISFDCLNLSNRRKDKCYLFGKTYNLLEDVPYKEISSACIGQAKCVNFTTPEAYFINAHNDCPEFFRYWGANCVLQYTVGECCSTGKVCDDDRNALEKCSLDGKTYLEGERMQIPGDPCRTCICSKDFDETNIMSSEKCFVQKCSFEINNEFKPEAAPVYRADMCCPWFWRSPAATDKVIKGAGTIDDPKLQCNYGDLTLNVGDSLEPVTTANGVGTCSCSIPPLVHCTLAKEGMN
ncbi:uncharacterized protein LOC131689721 [Topomyia yanbarensis]|uniref:uncharacterized protein LOC131689721 n=1 Tax=Topomyia yanbarensis TaxID=2498891 RepID=UPI00273A8C4F|nr:uncharacterized protein LOC131689721 [Topomyia yanbarensis]